MSRHPSPSPLETPFWDRTSLRSRPAKGPTRAAFLASVPACSIPSLNSCLRRQTLWSRSRFSKSAMMRRQGRQVNGRPIVQRHSRRPRRLELFHVTDLDAKNDAKSGFPPQSSPGAFSDRILPSVFMLKRISLQVSRRRRQPFAAEVSLGENACGCGCRLSTRPTGPTRWLLR